ncbi:type IV secretory system conjugative DNA transfer family protein [Angustibacter peucedani]
MDLGVAVLVAMAATAAAADAVLSCAASITNAATGHGWAWHVVTLRAQTPHHLGGREAGVLDSAAVQPTVFWIVSAALTALGLVALMAGVLAWRRRMRPEAGARWASARGELLMRVPAAPERRRHRLVAGRSRRTGRLLAGEDCISAIAIGPNGSGKTTSLIIPNTLEWDGPVVMTTTKPQDLEDVIAVRSRTGPVYVFAAAGLPEGSLRGARFRQASWSPVGYAADATSADRMAEWLCEASGLARDDRARAWVLQARKLIKPLLMAAHASGGGTKQFVQWIYDGQAAVERVGAVLAEQAAVTGAAEWTEAKREFMSTWAIHDEGVGSVLFTAYGIADAYSRSADAAVGEPFDVAQFLESGKGRHATLLIVAPESDGDRFAPVVTALLAAVVHAAEHRAAALGGPLPSRLLLALDEAANVLRFPRLPALLTTARGNGIQLLLAYHDLGQLEHASGSRQVARTILSNAKLRILLPGVGDLETLQYFSQLLGRSRVKSSSVTRAADGARSTSTSESQRELAPLHTLRELQAGQAVVAYQNLAPMRIRLRRSFADRDLRRLVAVASRAGAPRD